jgi:hypothetical protein
MSNSGNPNVARPDRPGRRVSSPSITDVTTDNRRRWQDVWPGMVVAVFFSRFFLPAESTVLGDTLWIAALWMLCGLAWAVGIWRCGFSRIRLDALDVAVAVWIGGQVVSALVVVLTVGDKRAAANMGWEWIAIGIVWLVFRHGIVEWSMRSAVLRSMMVTGAVLGGFGLYQHYVSHPQLVAEYGPLFDRLRTATASEAAVITQKLGRAGAPTEGPALVLFEKRLRDSSEPLGLFALANTLGGVLAACLLMTLGEAFAARRRGTGLNLLVPLIAAAVVMTWCLLLTKSRTAWMGGMCGLVVLAAPRAIRMAGSKLGFPANIRRFLLPAGISFVAVSVVIGLLLVAGGLDRQVLSEAPKSLAYRIQYWQATSRLIADHLWLGVGPGNFRQHYLKYKLPEASEEIADPHNLFFEVAATGGIVSALGLTMFLGLAFVFAGKHVFAARGLRAAPSDRSTRVAAADSGTGVPGSPGAPDSIVYWSAGGGAVLAFAGSLACFGEWEDRLLVLSVLWFIAAWVMKSSAATPRDEGDGESLMPLAASVTLVVHLLGAGGIGMPGVSQILVALIAMSLPPIQIPAQSIPAARVPPVPFAPTGRPIGSLLAAFGFAALLAGLSATALLPVLECRSLLRQGVASGWSASSNGREAAMAYFRDAALADSWSAEPWRNLFDYERSAAGGIHSNESFQVAVEHLLEASRRDPVNFWALRNLGTVWYQKWQRTGDAGDARQAVVWLRRAHELYPTNSAIQGELAFAMESAGEHEEAVNVARAALAQDAIYHQQGHVDRFLEDSVRRRLESLVAPKSP